MPWSGEMCVLRIGMEIKSVRVVISTEKKVKQAMVRGCAFVNVFRPLAIRELEI